MIFISLSVLVAVVIWRNRSQMSQVETQKKPFDTLCQKSFGYFHTLSIWKHLHYTATL